MSKQNFHNIGVVILAAGHGTRMKSDIPKVMHELNGKPLVGHVVDNAIASGVTHKPVVVVSPASTLVRSYFGETVDYAVQEEQLGTGHATAAAESVLKGRVDHVVVLYGDMPFFRAESIARLVKRHEERKNILTLMTVTVPNFDGGYTPFRGFSRIVRGEEGHIIKDVQVKDATPEELTIHECNPSVYCFSSDWLWSHLQNLKNDNAQEEYYLTDLIAMAIEEGMTISSIATDPHEALGINSREDWDLAQKAMSLRND